MPLPESVALADQPPAPVMLNEPPTVPTAVGNHWIVTLQVAPAPATLAQVLAVTRN
jgi:hypothetical protein